MQLQSCAIAQRLRGCLHRLALGWERLQVELNGQYSMPRMKAFHVYSHSASLPRVLLTSLPCLLAVALADAVTLAPPEQGLAHSHAFWVRAMFTAFTFSHATIEQIRYYVPRLGLSTARDRLYVSVPVSIFTIAATYAMALAIGFPSAKLSSDKKKKVEAFRSTTNARESTATSYLARFSWDLMRAVDDFYANGGEVSEAPSPASVSQEAISTWFDQYVDEEEDEDAINEDGILKFCEDIGVDPQDIVVLIIAWKMKAAYMCAFTRKEWKQGMEVMGVDSIEKLKAKLPALREEISSESSFKKFYSFCFGFSKEPGQKSLGIDIAVPMWELLLSTRFEKLTSHWLAFLKEKNPCKGVTRDTWDLLLDFFGKVRESYDDYDENEAWPVLIDDYMTWIEAQKL